MIRRGEIYYADLAQSVVSEQSGKRPVLVIQNNIGNQYSPTVIVAALTSVHKNIYIPTHVRLSAETCNLPLDSVVILEQIRTIDKRRLLEKITTLSQDMMRKVNRALVISIGFGG